MCVFLMNLKYITFSHDYLLGKMSVKVLMHIWRIIEYFITCARQLFSNTLS